MENVVNYNIPDSRTLVDDKISLDIDTGTDNIAELFNEIAEHIVDALRVKDIKYGSDNLVTFGLLGLIVRIEDKLARLKNTLVDAVDETYMDTQLVEDALFDIAGYAINGLRLLKQNKLKPLGTAMDNFLVIRKWSK